MDNMLEHPWNELQVLIKEKWLTQKAFASILWKKVSEVNELLKWKRNITIQRDYLLHQTLWTPIKYWILKQVDYDYSLLDIENISLPVRGAAEQSEAEGLSESHNHSEALAEESSPLDKEGLGEIWSHSEALAEESISQNQTSHSEPENHSANEERENISNTSPTDLSSQSKWQKKLEDEVQISPLDKGDTFTTLAWAKPRGFEQPQETPIQQPEVKNNEDLKNRAKIFRSF